MEPKLLGNKVLAKRLKGLAKLQLYILHNLMKFNNLKQYSRLLKSADGSWLKVSSVFGIDNITIYVPETATIISPVPNEIAVKIFKGFLCHPRIFGGRGWNPKGEELPNGPFTYPLVDDDHGTRGLKWVNSAWKRVNSPPENYGNIDWLGDKNKVLSWRGPAGRHFAMDSTKHYPGFTVWDYTEMAGGLEVEHYTPYRNVIYRGGEIVQDFLEGYKVLGCGVRKGKIVSVVGVDYAGRPNPDGGMGGFYDEVYLEAERIGFRSSSRPSTPWFFNSSGTEAVNGNAKLTISDKVDCEFSSIPPGVGTQRIVIPLDRSTWGLERNGSWDMFRDFSGLSERKVTLSVFDNESTTVQSSGNTENEYLPIMLSGTFPDTMTVTGPYAATVGAQYTAVISGPSGFISCADPVIEWSFSGGAINESGIITDITGCGTETVTATVSGGGFTLSGSMQVKLPIGQWVQVSYENCLPGHEITTYYYCEKGVYRYMDEGYRQMINVSIGGAWRWNSIKNKCIWIASGEWKSDLGYPTNKCQPYCKPLIAGTRVRDAGKPCEATFNLYQYVLSRGVYEWQCP